MKEIFVNYYAPSKGFTDCQYEEVRPRVKQIIIWYLWI